MIIKGIRSAGKNSPRRKENAAYGPQPIAVDAARKKRSLSFCIALLSVAAAVAFFDCLPSFASGKNEIFLSVQEGAREIAALSGRIIGGDIFQSFFPEEEAQSLVESAPASVPVPVPVSDKLRMEKVVREGKEKYEFEVLDGGKVEFFDPDEGAEYPYLEVEKWDGEARLKIRLPQAAAKDKKKDNKELKDNKLKIKGAEYGVEIYPRPPEERTMEVPEKVIKELSPEETEAMADEKEAAAASRTETFTLNEDGGAEFDLILDSVPASNVFEFPVEAEGLDFAYQPPLHPEHPTWSDEDGDNIPDHFRPEVIIGSYAVYCQAREGLMKEEEEADKYKAGKAFHIYRPRISDAADKEIWGELGYDEAAKVLRVTVDRAWLNGATYPVRIDPDIGYATAGASYTTAAAGALYSSYPAAAGNGVATSISAYIRYTTSGNAGSAECNIYDSGCVPLDAGGTEVLTTNGTASWRTFNYAAGPVLSSTAGNYYVTLWVAKASRIYYDTESSTKIVSQTKTYDGVWPNTAVTAAATTRYSVYATYRANSNMPTGMGVSGGGMMMF